MTKYYISYQALIAVGAPVGQGRVTHTSPTSASSSAATEDLKMNYFTSICIQIDECQLKSIKSDGGTL